MNPSLLASLVIILALTTPVFARLGDTPEQCNQRYGAKYTEKGGDGFWTAERVYEVNGIRLTFRFLPAKDGLSRAAYVDYKPAKGKMSEVQIQTLLETVTKDWKPLTELRDEKKNATKAALEAEKARPLHGTKKFVSIESSSGSDKRKKEKDEKEREEYLTTLAAKNKLINESKDRIRTTAEWYEPRTGEALNCWTSPTAFAGSSPQRVVIFTSEYLRQHEKGAETIARDKNGPPPQANTGFSGF
jgi:hypothetical protein